MSAPPDQDDDTQIDRDGMGKENLSRVTYTWEKIRSVLSGLLEVVWQPGASVVLLVAIRHFDAGTLPKSILSASGFLGFLIAPLSLSVFAQWGRPITRTMAGIHAAAGVLLVASAFATSLGSYVALVALAHVVLMQHLPLHTEMYRAHFTTRLRGKRIATVFLVGGVVGSVASLGVGHFLDVHLEGFRVLLALAGFCALGAGFCVGRIPSRPLDVRRVGHPLRNLSVVAGDGLFAWMLAAWMFIGLGNLMTLPLRVEYMANPQFGINASNQTILIVTGVVPLIAKLLTTRLLGHLFDHMNLVLLRVGINFMFLCSMILYFSTRNLFLMAFAMALLGGAMAGGKIMWSLWVTKLAPPDKTSAYMSVHMMFTGLRGSIAPFLGYLLIGILPIDHVAWIGCGLTLLSIGMFLPAKRYMDRRGQQMGGS